MDFDLESSWRGNNVKFKSTLLILSAALVASSTAWGKLKPLPDEIQTQLLVEITNDRDRDVSNMALMIDPSAKVSGLYTETESSGDVVENNIYPLKELQSSKGVLVEEYDGREVIRMQGKVDESKGKAELKIRYLSNGLWGNYKVCKLAAERDGNGQWQAYNPETGRAVRQVHVVTYALGIEKLQGACD